MCKFVQVGFGNVRLSEAYGADPRFTRVAQQLDHAAEGGASVRQGVEGKAKAGRLRDDWVSRW